jgi:nicotinate-nucleotide--dimethylbenzimidazole phosphoribosyltransferase
MDDAILCRTNGYVVDGPGMHGGATSSLGRPTSNEETQSMWLERFSTEDLPTLPALGDGLGAALRRAIDGKTKPVGALGRVEELALLLGRVQGTLAPRVVRPAVLVFAGDHGATRTPGLSAYPREVTWQMVANFLAGGAAINVFARTFGLELEVVDAGVDHDFRGLPGLRAEKIARGTRSYLEGRAMERGEVDRALAVGARVAREHVALGSNVLALGEMGIGNTASAALVTHGLCEVPLADVVGRGTGLDDAGLERKRALLERAVALHGRPRDAREVLGCYGGFEIAMLVGALVEGARRGAVVVVDGFIVTAAALVAQRLVPGVIERCVFAHCSQEVGHRVQLAHLGARALLDLDLRLGEGTGAALAVPLLRAAAAMLGEMASFEGAGVDGPTVAPKVAPT